MESLLLDARNGLLSPCVASCSSLCSRQSSFAGTTPRVRTRGSRAAHVEHVACQSNNGNNSNIRKDGSVESRGLRPLDKEQPTLREQFLNQKQQGEASCAHVSVGLLCIGQSSDLRCFIAIVAIPADAVTRTADSELTLQAAAAAAATRARDGSGSGSPIKTTGLRRTPLSGGVIGATQQYDLPSPAVAVRNLVSQNL